MNGKNTILYTVKSTVWIQFKFKCKITLLILSNYKQLYNNCNYTNTIKRKKYKEHNDIQKTFILSKYFVNWFTDLSVIS